MAKNFGRKVILCNLGFAVSMLLSGGRSADAATDTQAHPSKPDKDACAVAANLPELAKSAVAARPSELAKSAVASKPLELAEMPKNLSAEQSSNAADTKLAELDGKLDELLRRQVATKTAKNASRKSGEIVGDCGGDPGEPGCGGTPGTPC